MNAGHIWMNRHYSTFKYSTQGKKAENSHDILTFLTRRILRARIKMPQIKLIHKRWKRLLLKLQKYAQYDLH